MDLDTFAKTLSHDHPPEPLPPLLEALWYDAKGDWDRAHRIVQELPGQAAAGVHAYLHRKEGDTWNADYWYSRAGRRRSSQSLQAEWRALVSAALHPDDQG
jgi:hypothetical protein